MIAKKELVIKKAVSLTKESSSSVHLLYWMFRSQSADLVTAEFLHLSLSWLKKGKKKVMDQFCHIAVAPKTVKLSFAFERSDKKDKFPLRKGRKNSEKCTFVTSIVAPFSGSFSAFILRYFGRKNRLTVRFICRF